MSVASILRKELKDGYYIVFYDDMQYAPTEYEALRIVEVSDKAGLDTAVYHYRNGVFYRCRVGDLEKLFLKEQKS